MVRSVVRGILVVAAVGALAPFAQAGPSTRPATQPSTATTADAEAVKRAMRSFLAEAATRRYEQASLRYCHADDEAERAMGIMMAQLFYSQHVCRLVVETRLGREVAARAVELLGRHDVDGASVLFENDEAILRIKRGVEFPMVKIDGRWKLSMRRFCEQEKSSALALAYGYLQMSQGHLAATQDVQAGRCANAAEVKAAIQLHISEADQALRKRREQSARNE
jgi:hypothetical protein